jgi:NTE family protein
MTAVPGGLGLVMGGGGALGARQVGALTAVVQAGLRPDLLVGTSVGALNAAAAALDLSRAVPRLQEIWDAMRGLDLFSVRSGARAAARRRAFCDTRALEALVRRGVGDAHFSDLAIPLVVVATDMDTRERVLLESGPVAPALMASAAIPFVFPAVELGGRRLVDGGFSDVLPVGVALDRGCDRVLAAPARTDVPYSAGVSHGDRRVVMLAERKRERGGPMATMAFGRTRALRVAGEWEARAALHDLAARRVA